jgi:hypothetical protein
MPVLVLAPAATSASSVGIIVRDPTAASLQAAMAASPGQTFVLPAGTYTMAGGVLKPPAGTRITGAGAGVTILQLAAGATAPLFSLTNDGVTIDNLTLDGNGTNQTSTAASLISSTTAAISGVTVDHATIQNAANLRGATCVMLTNASYVSFTDNSFSNCGSGALIEEPTLPVTNFQFSRNRVDQSIASNNFVAMFLASAVTSATISNVEIKDNMILTPGNTLESDALGVGTSAANPPLISNVTVSGNLLIGEMPPASPQPVLLGLQLGNVTDETIANNVISGYRDGIFIENCPSPVTGTVTGNSISNNNSSSTQHAGGMGILEASGCGGLSYTGNTINDLRGDGIRATDPGYFSSNAVSGDFIGVQYNSGQTWVNTTVTGYSSTGSYCTSPLSNPATGWSFSGLTCAGLWAYGLSFGGYGGATGTIFNPTFASTVTTPLNQLPSSVVISSPVIPLSAPPPGGCVAYIDYLGVQHGATCSGNSVAHGVLITGDFNLTTVGSMVYLPTEYLGPTQTVSRGEISFQMLSYACSANPTIALEQVTGPDLTTVSATLGTKLITGPGLLPGTWSGSLAAGNWYAFQVTGGTCTNLNVQLSATY